ncbi:MAG: family 1 encapsulin nanocompartment shell protein [candidate division KSB1 bacterium]|nr:family 1 encapsulin nanocompartment shell protein [candidate division KSB1 bacterium]
MDILKRSLAPLTDEAWQEIDETARAVLVNNLSARKVVDVDGPKGWDFGAIPLGRLDIPKGQSNKQVQFGTFSMLPLTEVRVPFKLNIWEIDNLIRGARDVDLDSLEKAAENTAKFEEQAIYYGFKQGRIQGLKEASENEPLSLPKDAKEALAVVTRGIRVLEDASIGGPYTLVVNPKKWQQISSYTGGYPVRRQLEEILGGQIVLSPQVDDVFLVSQRGEDFQLTLGADLSIWISFTRQQRSRVVLH